MPAPTASRPALLRRHAQTVICCLIAFLVATPMVVIAINVHVRAVSSPFIYDRVPSAPPRLVAIVPGTTVNDGIPASTLTQRLQAALNLYRAGKARIILVSGSREEGYDEPTAMHAWLVRHGVHDADIVDDPAGYRTLDTMERAARVYKVKSAIICSQAVNLPRAVFLARHAGIDAVGMVANPGGPAHLMYAPHETLGSAVAFVETAVGRGPQVLGPPQPIDGDLRTTALLR